MQYSTSEFESIYRLCFPSAMRMALSLLHDEDEARDTVHEAFLRLWESKSRIDNTTAYIISIVRNICLNRLSALGTREKMRRRLTLEPAADNPDSDEQHELVRKAVGQLLTAREREVIDKIYVERLSYKDAAESLGVSTAAINKHLTSALRKLRNHFNPVKP